MRAYPRYRDSGIEWLGEVPKHWDVRPFRYVCRLAYGESLASEAREDGDVPVFGSNGVVGQHDAPNTRSPVIVVGRKGSHGEVNFSEVEAFAIDTTYFVDERYTASDVRWLYYVLLRADLADVSKDSAIPGLSRDDAYAKALPLPPLDEQHAIAAYLDRETERIDALVAKKRLLIERLEEYRTALITRTVTRGLAPEAARAAGLDPSPRLKPSGVEWLGDVPQHWQVAPLYTRYSVDLGKMLREDRTRGDHLVAYLRNVDVQWDRINFDDLPEIDVAPSEFERYTVLPGDLLVCEGGEVGRAAIVPEHREPIAYQKALHRLRPKGAEDPRFMFYTLRFAVARGIFEAGGNPNTILHLTGEMLRRYRFPRPPQEEQIAIARFLDDESAKIDGLLDEVETAIERLQEYRTALITAAVTGKIDVRE